MSVPKKTKKRPSLWFLYILKCSDTTFYSGITNDLKRRIEMHNAGNASHYTRSRRPVKLMYYERCRNKSSALKKEYAIKALTRVEKVNYMSQRRKCQDPSCVLPGYGKFNPCTKDR
jgi:putative endonuclease